MKILITSDIHANIEITNKLIEKYPTINYHLDAGDSQLSNNTLNSLKIISVIGNTDNNDNLRAMKILNINNKKILLVHGHNEGVKTSIVNLSLKAKLNNCDIVIFGHTHKPFNKTIDNILYLNPGSLGYDGTYIIIENNNARFYTI